MLYCFQNVESSFRASEARPGIQKKMDSCFRRNEGNKNFCDRLNNKWFSVLILTDCNRAPLKGQQSKTHGFVWAIPY
jgi:hypothetical protein